MRTTENTNKAAHPSWMNTGCPAHDIPRCQLCCDIWYNRQAGQADNNVHAGELSKIAMVEGNESKYRIVIDNGVVKEWIGIGWITLNKATSEDWDRYPKVVREEK